MLQSHSFFFLAGLRLCYERHVTRDVHTRVAGILEDKVLARRVLR